MVLGISKTIDYKYFQYVGRLSRREKKDTVFLSEVSTIAHGTRGLVDWRCGAVGLVAVQGHA